MQHSPVLVELLNVSKNYESGDHREGLPVLRHLNLQVERGESLAIIGPSGSGKSTLLNIIGTLDHPTEGTVLLDGKEVGKLGIAELAALRNRQIGFVFQSHYLLPHCTVLENVLVPTLASRDDTIRNGAEARARQLLDRVGLKDRLSHRPGQLSGGERQRVAVVRALINRPQLLLADEPTGALDRVSAQSMAHLLAELNKEQQVTLVVVTHALDLAGQMKRIFELQDGQIHPWSAAQSQPR